MQPYREPLQLPEIAYYYPEPVWEIRDDGGSWIKNLVLFFDGIGLLVPDYIEEKPFDNDPSIAHGLRDKGLLHIFNPETIVDEGAVKRMSNFLVPMIERGSFDHLRSDKSFDYLSGSRLGYVASRRVFNEIHGRLVERGLAGDTTDGVSYPVQQTVRTLILVLWSQFLRAPGRQMGFDFQPTTDRPQVYDTLGRFLQIPTLPSSGHVVTLDMQTVGVDLSQVPIDEVISFKQQNDTLYKSYRKSVKAMIHDIGESSSVERSNEMLGQRKEEIEEIANSIRKISLSTWGSVIGFSLGALGAAWTVTHGQDSIQGILDFGGLIASGLSVAGDNTGAYSYLFKAKGKLNYY